MVSGLKPLGLIIVFLALIFHVSATQFELSGGDVKEENVDSQEASKNWVGVSGDLERFDQGLSDKKIGELTFDDSRSGSIVEQSLPGLGGGGYFLAFAPYGEKVEVSNISSLETRDLEKNGLFRKEDFPSFYPDYENISDTPDETFTSTENVMLENTYLNLSRATLSSGVDLYLGKYSNTADVEMPVFIVPLEGTSYDGTDYNDCYDGGSCSFEFILPRYNQTENLYSINFWSSGKPVSGCGEVPYNGSTYVIDGSLSDSAGPCINMTADDLVLDLLHQTVSGSGDCGIRITADRNYLRGGTVTGFQNGICSENSSSSGIISSEVDADTAINATNSDLRATELASLATQFIDARNSTLETESVRISGTRIAGTYENLDIRPSDISQQVDEKTELEPLNFSIQANEVGSGSAEGIGFYYPPVNDTGVEPTDILHIKQQNGSYTVEELEQVQIDLSGERLIYSGQEVTNFSYFAVFGEKVQNEEEVVEEVEEVEEVVEETVVEETVTSPPPPPAPTSEPIMVDLNATSEAVEVTRGEVAEIGFELENYGEVPTGDFLVGADLPPGWNTVSEPIESLQPGDSTDTTVLVETSQDIRIGNYSHVFQAFRNRTTLDIETARITVKPSETDARLEILSAPSYIRTEKGETQTVGVLVENSGSLELENIGINFRNLDCAEFSTRDYRIESGEQETFRFDITAGTGSDTCTGALVIENDDRNLAFHPISIEVSKPTDRGSPVIIPVLVIIWTFVTLYEVFG